MKLLQQLCEIPAPSGSEGPVRDFILEYIQKKSRRWKVKPELFYGKGFQDCIIAVFGKPRTAVFAHMDTVGFIVRYMNQLLPIGSPHADPGTVLVGSDLRGTIECRVTYDDQGHALYDFGRTIAPGTLLTYKVNFTRKGKYIHSAYLDNRLGVYNALKLAETLTDGILGFSCWEEHGGGAVPYLAKFIYENYGVSQALISDITWVSDGVHPGKGVAVSVRDRSIPRRTFIDHIISLASASSIPFQIEVEGEGSSDGRELQLSPYPFDWCFVGAPQQDAHSPSEKVHVDDIQSMLELYALLMKKL